MGCSGLHFAVYASIVKGFAHPPAQRVCVWGRSARRLFTIVIGWELGRRLHAELATKALQMALHERTWEPGVLIHHSDRGVQYASRAYTKLLVEHEIRVSMSRRGSPYENARAEGFMRTQPVSCLNFSDRYFKNPLAFVSASLSWSFSGSSSASNRRSSGDNLACVSCRSSRF